MSLNKSNNFTKEESDRFVYLVTYTTSGAVGRGFIDFAEEMDSPEKVIHCENSLMKSLNVKELIITNFQLIKKESGKKIEKDKASSVMSDEELTVERLKISLDLSEKLRPYKSNLHCLIMNLMKILDLTFFSIHSNGIVLTNEIFLIELRIQEACKRPDYVLPDAMEFMPPNFDATVDFRTNGITMSELQPSMLDRLAKDSNLDLIVSGLVKNK